MRIVTSVTPPLLRALSNVHQCSQNRMALQGQILWSVILFMAGAPHLVSAHASRKCKSTWSTGHPIRLAAGIKIHGQSQKYNVRPMLEKRHGQANTTVLHKVGRPTAAPPCFLFVYQLWPWSLSGIGPTRTNSRPFQKAISEPTCHQTERLEAFPCTPPLLQAVSNVHQNRMVLKARSTSSESVLAGAPH